MLPILFNIGPIPIHTYGLLIAIGFLVGVEVVKRLLRREKLPEEKIIDLMFQMLLVGFLGARVLFVMTQLHEFSDDPLAIFKVWEGGLVFYGGPLFVIPFAAWRLKRMRISVSKSLDAFAPGLTIAHMFGRFGCIAAGCCYGKPTGTSFGFRFHTDRVDQSLWDIPLHPTQAYEAIGLFVIFLGLMWISRHKRFDGQMAVTYLLTYPVLRSIVEIYRGDLVRGFVIEGLISTSQFISFLVFLVGAGVLISKLRRHDSTHTI